MYPQNTHVSAGSPNRSFLAVAVLGIAVVGLLVFGVWAFMNYLDQKNNVDAIVGKAVDTAKQEQKDVDDAAFAEQEKQPTVKLAGPSDLGGATVSYPKTWSAYVDKDGTGGVYAAYLHPGAVKSISQKAINAVVITVEDREYEATLKTYDSTVAKGDLKASPVKLGDQVGTRLDGTFSKDVQGAEVLFKLRDKTLSVAVQSNDYLSDFNNIILPSLTFNP
jgi:hypothetical protein